MVVWFKTFRFYKHEGCNLCTTSSGTCPRNMDVCDTSLGYDQETDCPSSCKKIVVPVVGRVYSFSLSIVVLEEKVLAVGVSRTEILLLLFSILNILSVRACWKDALSVLFTTSFWSLLSAPSASLYSPRPSVDFASYNLVDRAGWLAYPIINCLMVAFTLKASYSITLYVAALGQQTSELQR